MRGAGRSATAKNIALSARYRTRRAPRNTPHPARPSADPLAGSPLLRSVPAFAGLPSCRWHDEFASGEPAAHPARGEGRAAAGLPSSPPQSGGEVAPRSGDGVGVLAPPRAFVIPWRSRSGARAKTMGSMPEHCGQRGRRGKGARPAGAPRVDMGLRAEGPARDRHRGSGPLRKRGKVGLRPHCCRSECGLRRPKLAFLPVPSNGRAGAYYGQLAGKKISAHCCRSTTTQSVAADSLHF